MIYIYNCYGGTHSSSIASAIHLGKLPKDRIPTKGEILSVDYFDRLNSKDMGKVIFRGIDNDGNNVYTIGRGTTKVLVPCIECLVKLFHEQYGFSEKVVLSNMSPAVPPLMTLGGTLSRGFGLESSGRFFLAMGVRQTYKKMVHIVNGTIDKARDMKSAVMVLNNKEYDSRIRFRY